MEVDGTRLQGFTDQQAAECLARTGEVSALSLSLMATTPVCLYVISSAVITASFLESSYCILNLLKSETNPLKPTVSYLCA